VFCENILCQSHGEQNHHRTDSQNFVPWDISFLVRKEIFNSASYLRKHLVGFPFFVCHYNQLLTMLTRVPFSHVVVYVFPETS
jgi:hypothetical protein